MLMTVQLWRAFYDSLPRHPLFWQTLTSGNAPVPVQVDWRWRLRQAGAAILGLLIFIGIIALGIPILFLSYLILLAGAVLAGGHAAAGISAAIGQEQEKGRYDLIALSPPGMFGAGWALATRFLRTNRNTLRLTRLIRAFHIMCFFGAVGIVLMNVVLAASTGIVENLTESGLVELSVVIVLVCALHLDFLQAVLMGALVGILAPTYTLHTQRRLDTALVAVAMFLLIQFTLYLVIYATLNIVTAVMGMIGLDVPVLLIALLALALVFITHEIALYWIWRMVQQRLNLEPRMLQTLKLFGV
jgi:hypothetical protein